VPQIEAVCCEFALITVRHIPGLAWERQGARPAVESQLLKAGGEGWQVRGVIGQHAAQRHGSEAAVGFHAERLMRLVTEDFNVCWLQLCCRSRGSLPAAGQPDPSDLPELTAVLGLEGRLRTGTMRHVRACR